MTLPASGAISTAQIRAEIGGSGAVTIPSSEVRTLTGVASGAIVLPTDFHGKDGAGTSDQTPDALAFNDVSETDALSGVTNSQTLAGINVPITIRATISSVASSSTSSNVFSAYVNSSLASSVAVSNGAYLDVVVSVGNTLYFRSEMALSGIIGCSTSYTVSLTNQSSGGASLDSFSVSLAYTVPT
jgi:hypothetical protein